MTDTQLRWSWLLPVNKDRAGNPLNVYCWVCRTSIADQQPRAMNSKDRKPECKGCAAERGCPPEEELQQSSKKNATDKSAARLTSNESGEIIQALQDIRSELQIIGKLLILLVDEIPSQEELKATKAQLRNLLGGKKA